MKTQSTMHVRAAIQQNHGMPFVDFIRTHYWASFSTLPVVAEKCGITLDELRRLMDEEAWELQKPPSLARQNRAVADLEVLDAVERSEKRVDAFIRDFERNPAACPTRLGCRVEKDRLRLWITCREDCMQDLSFMSEDPLDADTEALWSGDTEALQKTAAWLNGPEHFREWRRQVGERPRSIFTDDCLVLTLSAVAVGECPAYLAPVRLVRDPLPMLADPPVRPGTPRIQLEGSYYYIAIAPTGQVVGTFYDPWDDGVYWPCWQSGARAEISRRDDEWVVDITLPLANLEPLPVRDSVWGLDFFRRRPARGKEPAEWTRSAESIFFRQTHSDLGEGRFLNSPEEFDQPGPRHAYLPSVLPFADRITPRDIPSVAVRPASVEPDDLGDDTGADAETIHDLWLDQTGGMPRSRTDVHIAHDHEFLYLRFDCYDEDIAHLRVVTREQEHALYGTDHRRANYLDRREAFGLDWGDYVEALLAPGLETADIYHGGYYNILVNSRGQVLKRYYDPYGACALPENEAWQPELRVRVQIRDEYWQVCLGIPFAALHDIDRATDTWRGNFRRARGTRDASGPSPEGSEFSAWSPEYGRCRLLERLGFLRFEGGIPRCEAAPEGRGPAIVRGDTDEEMARKTSPSSAHAGLSGIHFATLEKGWAVGGLGTILHTDDRGKTWQSQDANTDHILEKVFFLDERRGFAVGGRPRSQRVAIVGNAGIILATKDGGASWSAAFSDAGAYLCDVCFANDRVGYAVGEYDVAMKTTDGGEHWDHLANTGTDNWLLAVHFVDENHGWAAGEEGTIVATNDGGQTWRGQDAPTPDLPFGCPAAIRSIHFQNQLEGWIAGDRGTFMHSGDGGQTWQPVDLGLPFPLSDVMHFNAVRFFDEGQGILVGEPGAIVYHTQDGGRTWKSEEGPASTALRDLCFDPRGQAWAVDELGRMARRGDRGWNLASGDAAKPRLLFGTPHGHHVSSVPWPAMADQYDIFAVFGERTLTLSSHSSEAKRINTNVGCLEVGMRGTRSMLDMPAGRRREPHRIHHLYQNWQGIEPTERRLVAAIRSLKPEIVIAEWPILQEGYWAADVGIFARALIRAFNSAADPECFKELEQIGLVPWRAERLYAQRLHMFSDAYRIADREDWRVRAKGSDFVEALGASVGAAMFRGRCARAGLLDRGQERRAGASPDAVHEQCFHLVKQR